MQGKTIFPTIGYYYDRNNIKYSIILEYGNGYNVGWDEYIKCHIIMDAYNFLPMKMIMNLLYKGSWLNVQS